ncbi:MAG TPA: hypothetical protein VFT66_20850 [Roseiflexaceae bacterium]|jgi:hypothetical protein|nr:hypothetical protein [Roseiflexaceae bacterium]
MTPELGRAGFSIAVFLVVTGGVLLVILPPDSAEFIVTALAVATGLLTIVIIAVLARLGR